MKRRLIKVLFTIPFCVLDMIAFPVAILYWIASRKLVSPFMQQLWEDEK
jgi:hypothetical protein